VGSVPVFVDIDDLKDIAQKTGQAMNIGILNPAEAPRFAEALGVKMIIPENKDTEKRE
jgi:hypothetical protein